MDVTVRFRFNKLTGEVERFDIDQDSTLPMVEHERSHDRLAAEIGALLERFPRVTEVVTDAEVATTGTTTAEPGPGEAEGETPPPAPLREGEA